MGREEERKRERQKAAREAQGEAANSKAGEPGGTPAPDPVDPLARHAEQVLIDQAGDHWASRPGGKGEAENARLVAQSLRWATSADAGAYKGVDASKLSARDVAVLATRRGMLAADDRTTARHVTNLIRMEGQNQRDQLEDNGPVDPDPAGKLQVVIQEMRVVLQETVNRADVYDDFYASETVPADHPATPVALARVARPDAAP